MSKIDKANQPDYCVACGAPTGYTYDTPVDCRKNYIHGCGQLCEKCVGQLDREQHRHGTGETPLEEVNRIMAALKSTDEGELVNEKST